MSPEVVQGLAFGLGLGAANTAASILLYHFGRKKPGASFYRIVFAGLVVRMVVVLLMVALIIQWSSVNVSAFVGSLLAVFVVGLGLEIYVMHNNPAGGEG